MGKEIRETFLKRLYMELQSYKENVLAKEKEEIFAESYRTELLANFYEILVEKIQTMPEALLYELISKSDGILEFLYWKWLKWEDGFYEELKEFVAEELEMYQSVKSEGGEEEADGKEGERHHTVASGK